MPKKVFDLTEIHINYKNDVTFFRFSNSRGRIVDIPLEVFNDYATTITVFPHYNEDIIKLNDFEKFFATFTDKYVYRIGFEIIYLNFGYKYKVTMQDTCSLQGAKYHGGILRFEDADALKAFKFLSDIIYKTEFIQSFGIKEVFNPTIVENNYQISFSVFENDENLSLEINEWIVNRFKNVICTSEKNKLVLRIVNKNYSCIDNFCFKDIKENPYKLNISFNTTSLLTLFDKGAKCVQVFERIDVNEKGEYIFYTGTAIAPPRVDYKLLKSLNKLKEECLVLNEFVDFSENFYLENPSMGFLMISKNTIQNDNLCISIEEVFDEIHKEWLDKTLRFTDEENHAFISDTVLENDQIVLKMEMFLF